MAEMESLGMSIKNYKYILILLYNIVKSNHTATLKSKGLYLIICLGKILPSSSTEYHLEISISLYIILKLSDAIKDISIKEMVKISETTIRKLISYLSNPDMDHARLLSVGIISFIINHTPKTNKIMAEKTVEKIIESLLNILLSRKTEGKLKMLSANLLDTMLPIYQVDISKGISGMSLFQWLIEVIRVNHSEICFGLLKFLKLGLARNNDVDNTTILKVFQIVSGALVKIGTKEENIPSESAYTTELMTILSDLLNRIQVLLYS
ncbi:hypothetical protein BEWA_030980 [Theileria equi strain WA]|uniref:Uncharacterized protein n=1 Tax=Theileria equi strain WA TaxID=1537102 RepID=L0AXF0_THEEQ|nr:hypothetical protein BEWA_030980 [Theileria equi strain WA]AFZ80245.1 hypothetical protein BEWA_030980 [Theileria equi strain WA]|eukprot:XP_004829911.1 hypothetical protein BEWA_030980 [Theileria equi strain WA]